MTHAAKIEQAQDRADIEPVSYTHLDVYKRQEQLGGLFHPELLDILDGRDAQHLPETAQTGALAEGHAARDELDCQLFCVVFLLSLIHI